MMILPMPAASATAEPDMPEKIRLGDDVDVAEPAPEAADQRRCRSAAAAR
jgi:hypothetical protein